MPGIQHVYDNGPATQAALLDSTAPFANERHHLQQHVMPKTDFVYDRHGIYNENWMQLKFPCDDDDDDKNNNNQDASGLKNRRQNHSPPKSATRKCRWEGCKYLGSFRRDADLLRHVKAVHVSPDAYTCPIVGCGKPFGRKDKMEAHRRAHIQIGMEKRKSSQY
ncbi:hypothetical protein BGW36DRAFT_357096 [Talaromyces proteolyticus]|uniref:C2H2-type domain-containing protein n=1 Tax=Talaromyces proteolyticus TaxID=1131652 RepID=A0AAD4KT60_9EURO|nr:uncharacterized protein BGW36DRAFT_357096 [Talaromyces proteolyticus]KAH8700437.1 hypothetical protein BGW36DRAFT_357096 [Talaromyces proteolyticus]